MSSSLSSSIASPLPSLLPSSATTVLPPQASCTPGAFGSPPAETEPLLKTGSADSLCGIPLYGQDYNVSTAISVMRGCCGNYPVHYYSDGCGLYCHTDTQGNATDFSGLDTCLGDHAHACIGQSKAVSVQSSSSTTGPSATTSPSPSPTGAAGKVANEPMSKAAGFLALVMLASGLLGVAA